MEELKITLIQTSLFWEDTHANLLSFDEKLKTVSPGDQDIIVLPEMFTTGFSMNAVQLAQTMDGQAVYWMSQIAKEKEAVVTGSLIIKENGHYYNRLIWMRPDGSYESYDKRHLFRMANEHLTYTSGNNKLIVEIKGWKIRPLICYDLRFPVWSRNINNEYDCLIYIANWPEKRSFAWKHLLIARAIENQAYIIGLNRTGVDGKEVTYSGDSAVLNPRGEYLFNAGNNEMLETVTLAYDELNEYRKSFPLSLDADKFSLE